MSLRTVVVSSWLGTTIEFYDFMIYGLAAALLFGEVFFPRVDPATAVLASFATFGAGYCARPLGAMLFGHLGDTIGRRKTLLITMAGMGLTTFLVGCLPDYEQVGVLAPLLLVVLRLVQGLMVGGEWGGAMLLVVESAPTARRGFYGALPQCGGLSAQFLASATFSLLAVLPAEALLSWGWRLPFLCSGVLALAGFWMRRQVAQSAALPPAGVRRLSPALTVWRSSWRRLLLIMALRLADGTAFLVATVFTVSYATREFGIGRQTLLNAIMVCCVAALPAYAFFGALSDRIGHRRLYIASALALAGLAFPFFLLLQTGEAWTILLAYVVLINGAHNANNAVQPVLLCDLFVVEERYSGMSVGYHLAAVVAGGLTPLVAASVSLRYGHRWEPVAAYMVLTSLLSALAGCFYPQPAKPTS
jgi:MFS family permease